MTRVVVPLMLLASSVLMAFAWLGHIRFRDKKYFTALLASWFLVLPEYLLNITAIRHGHSVFSGGEMASFNLCSGVFCVAMVARFFLKERLSWTQISGFVLMALAVIMVVDS